jgi:hypothetical protein
MGKLMDQSGQPSVGRQAIGNRDSPRPAVTRSVRCAGVGELDGVVDLAGELDELGDQSLVTVARDLGGRRRGERNRLGWWGKLGDLVLSKDAGELEAAARLFVGVSACVTPRLQLAFGRRAWRPNADSPAALGHAVPEIQPGAEPGDSFGGGVLVEDQENVPPRVGVKPGTDFQVGLPPIA